MGSCTFGSPAKTMSPTRSCCSPSKSLLMAYLVRSRRLGSKSSASIEFETSTTSIISTPWLFSSRSFEPSCGRAAARMSSASAVQKRMNFSFTRPVETSGISSRSTSRCPKRSSRLRRLRAAAQKSAASSGSSQSSQRYCGLAKRNIAEWWGRPGRVSRADAAAPPVGRFGRPAGRPRRGASSPWGCRTPPPGVLGGGGPGRPKAGAAAQRRGAGTRPRAAGWPPRPTARRVRGR